MLISHKHKFIFIKTEKTAGTSIEIALSKYCGLNDVITPIGPKGEKKRKELGGKGPQNYKVKFSKYSKFDFLRALYHRKRICFYNHASASYIRDHLDQKIWDSYFKFSFERNPWDKALSWYYWKYKTEPRPSITDFIQSAEASTVRGFELYSCLGEVAVDKVFKYEDLETAMGEIAERIGLKEIPSLPRLKADTRTVRQGYRDVLSEKDRDKIAKVFAREIAYFDYKW